MGTPHCPSEFSPLIGESVHFNFGAHIGSALCWALVMNTDPDPDLALETGQRLQDPPGLVCAVMGPGGAVGTGGETLHPPSLILSVHISLDRVLNRECV